MGKKEIKEYLKEYTLTKEALDIIQSSDIINKEGFDIWSFKKLIFLEYYIKPYLQILENLNFNCFYIDLYSSSGANMIKGTNQMAIGSPIISMLKGVISNKRKGKNNRFKKWYFIEKEGAFCDALKKRIERTIDIINNNDKLFKENIKFEEDIKIVEGDCNKEIKKVIEDIEKLYKGESNAILVFIDPYSFTNIEWETWKELLKMKYVDIIFTFPINTIKRGFDNCKHIEKYLPPDLLKKCGGKRICDVKENELSKCYAQEISKITKRSITYYEKGIRVENSVGGELYRVELFSHSKKAVSISLDVAKRLNKIKNSDLKKFFEQLNGIQSSLNKWF